MRCEDGLVDAIIQDMGREPGVLPLMEHALARLWEHVNQNRVITLHDYHAIEGVQGALAQRAGRVARRANGKQAHTLAVHPRDNAPGAIPDTVLLA